MDDSWGASGGHQASDYILLIFVFWGGRILPSLNLARLFCLVQALQKKKTKPNHLHEGQDVLTTETNVPWPRD